MFAKKMLGETGDNTPPISSRTSRLRWMSYIGVGLVAVALIIALALLVPEDTSGVLIRDQSTWQHVPELPIHPQHIAVADSIWTVDEDNQLIRFENFNGAIWSWYQVQDDDTVSNLARRFHTTRRSIESRIDHDEMPVGEWIWIQGYLTFTPSDLGISESAQIREVFAHTNQLWMVVGQAEEDILVRFDGQSWQVLDEVPIEGRIEAFGAINTSDGSPMVVVLDQRQVLHQVGQVDSLMSISLAEVRQSLDLSPRYPDNLHTSLAITAAGHIFVLNDTLLHYNGSSWSTVPFLETMEGELLSILGTANHGVWMADESGHYWHFNANEGSWQSYVSQEMGLTAATQVYDVTSDGERALFATDLGILAFDGDRWSMDYRPERDAPIQAITFGNNDQIWALTEGEELGVPVWYTVGIIATVVSSLVFMGMTLRGLPRFLILKEYEKRRSIIEQGINEKLPQADEQKGKWEIGWRGILISISPILILAIVVIVMVIVWGSDTIKNLEDLLEQISEAFDHIFPGAPGWLKEIIGEFLIASLFFILGLPFATFALMRTKDPEKRAHLRRNIIGGFVGFLILAILQTLAEYTAEEAEGNLFTFVVGVLILLVFILIVIVFLVMFYQKFMGTPKSALSRGDYDTALSGLEKSTFSSTTNTPILWTGGALYVEAGRFEQAEELLRESIRKSEQSPIFGSFAFHPLQQLGAALNGQGRYMEAKDALEAALNIKKNSGYAFLRLAENYLFQNQSPELALELLDKAFKNRRGIFTPLGRVRYVEAEIWANRAWAYGMLRQHHEVDNALENAFAKSSEDIVPLYAGILWRAGKAMQFQRNRAKARDYFRQSLSIDPKGAFTARARESLSELDNDSA